MSADAVFGGAGGLIGRGVDVITCVVRGRVDVRETIRLTDVGVREVLGTAVAGAIVIGGIVGLQGLSYLTRYNASEVFGWAAALSAFRDVGPVLLAFAIAARLGTQNSADTAASAARERIDALCALGLDPLRVVIAPRVCAVTLTALLLYPPCAALMLFVAFVFALALGGQPVAVSWWSVVTYIGAGVLWEGLGRMALFGVVIGTATTHAGLSLWLSDRRAARDIGAAVYDGSVTSVIAISVVNGALSLAGGTG